jgi:geranylgeranyl pyrophosphate synthase
LLQEDPGIRSWLQTVITQESYESVSRAELLHAIEGTGALSLARKRAMDYAENALTAIDGLEDSPYTQALRSIPMYIVDRDR